MRRNKQENDKIDNAIIQGLGEGKTISQIAIEQGISQPAVSNRIKKMKERGVEIPKTSKIRKKQKKQKKQENDEIDDAIINGLKEGKTKSQIAIEQGISQPAVYKRIKKMKERGVEIPKISKKKQENDKIDNAIIQGLGEGKTISQIAIEQGISQPAVSNRIKKMKERGVEIPKTSKIRKKQKKQKKQENDEIDDAIINGLKEGKTKSQIAIKQKISQRAVYKRIKKMKERGVKIPAKKITRQEFEKAINNLIKSKNATKTQINELAKYYGVDIDIDKFFIEDNNQEGQGRT